MDIQQYSINWDSTSVPEEWNQFEQNGQFMFAESLFGKTEKIFTLTI